MPKADSPTRMTILATAKALQSLLHDNAVEIERGRQLPKALVQRLAEEGFFRLCIPHEYGGAEIDPLTLSQTIETLAEADGSTAWCVMIGATTGLTMAYLEPATARDLCRDPNVIFAGVFAPRGRAADLGDSYRVDGRWQWGSGSPHAHYIMGGCTILMDGQPQLLPSGMPDAQMLIAPRADVEFADNWDVMGLCGTGSQDFAFNGITVPKARSVALLTAKPLARPLYAFPVFGLLALGVASVMLGLGTAAIRELTILAAAKTPEGHRKPLAARSRTQEDVAEATVMLSAARSHLREVTAAAWDDAQHEGIIAVDRKRDLRMAAVHAARTSVRTVDMMYALAGGTSVYRTSPLQRIFRDVHVASQHMQVASPVLETAGRHLLGLEGDYAQL